MHNAVSQCLPERNPKPDSASDCIEITLLKLPLHLSRIGGLTGWLTAIGIHLGIRLLASGSRAI